MPKSVKEKIRKMVEEANNINRDREMNSASIIKHYSRMLTQIYKKGVTLQDLQKLQSDVKNLPTVPEPPSQKAYDEAAMKKYGPQSR